MDYFFQLGTHSPSQSKMFSGNIIKTPHIFFKAEPLTGLVQINELKMVTEGSASVWLLASMASLGTCWTLLTH